MKVTILGCGAAPGVPSISSGWGRCDPANPKNRRRRASLLVEEGATSILIDTSPDLRDQLLGAKVKRLDAVLYTHGHADHVHGLDELREINRLMKGPIAAYGTAETLSIVEGRFSYAFEGFAPGAFIAKPWLTANVITETQNFIVGGVSVRAFLQDHGHGTTVGFRLGDVVYSTDIWEVPEASKDTIRGAKIWIVGALSETPQPTHAHVDKVLGWVKELKPHRTVITHMSNGLDYENMVSKLLPVGVTPAYDGMVIEV